MSDLAISSVALPATTTAKADTPEKVRDAAQQFEALLIGQILRSARQSGSGWLGGADSSAECATDYAAQQFAAVLAQKGGLGLADMIAKGLKPKLAADERR
jgi:flagellar protein FlgJ